MAHSTTHNNMYLPSSFPKDIYWLWDKQERESPPLHRRKALLNAEGHTSANGHMNGQHSGNGNGDGGSNRQEQGSDANSDTRRQASNLYAPPLVGYSADFPGAQLSYLDYNIRRLVMGEDNVSFRLSHTPVAMSRLERLRRIKTHGYRTIRPVGIERTLEEILIAESRNGTGGGGSGMATSGGGSGYDTSGVAGVVGDMEASLGDSSLRHSANVTGTSTGGMENSSGFGVLGSLDLDAAIHDADVSRELRDDEFEDENENIPQEGNSNTGNTNTNVQPSGGGGNNVTDSEIHPQTLNTTGDSYNVDLDNYRVGQDTTGEDMNYENILLHNSNVREADGNEEVSDINPAEDEDDVFGEGGNAIPGFMAEDVAYQEGGDTHDILMATTTPSVRTSDLLAHIISMANSASSRSFPTNPTTWASPVEYSRRSLDGDDDEAEDDPNMDIDE